jgi:hypothetical protein
MASSSSTKLEHEAGIYAHGQDSAVHLEDAAESSQKDYGHQPAAEQAENVEEAEVDEDSDVTTGFESDSAFDSGSLLGDETDTLASSILNHRMENGRQYHAYRDGAYWGPNDELAKEILDFAHHMYLLTLDQKLHLAPVHHPQEILDVGTGTGIWAIVSDRHITISVHMLTATGHGRPKPLRNRNRYRPLSHTTRMGPAELSLRDRRRVPRMDLPAQPLRLHTHPRVVWLHTRLGLLLRAGV